MHSIDSNVSSKILNATTKELVVKLEIRPYFANEQETYVCKIRRAVSPIQAKTQRMRSVSHHSGIIEFLLDNGLLCSDAVVANYSMHILT